MDGFAAVQCDGDERDIDGGRDACQRAYLDLAFDAGLEGDCQHGKQGPGGDSKGRMRTKVADIPGYPIRKLLLGGPETRTKADMVAHDGEGEGEGEGGQPG